MMTPDHGSFKELYEARHEPENLRPLAELYWRVVLLVAVIASGLAICFGVWEFSSVTTTMSSASEQGTSQQTAAIDKAKLEEVLVKFGERSANFEMGKTITPEVTDPAK